MSRRFPPEAILRGVRGRNGAMDIVLTVGVPHGKRMRDVEVPLSPEFIIALADALRCCPAHVGEMLDTGSVIEGTHRKVWRDYANPGHAVWHLENPNAVRPCLDGGAQVIDVADETKLAAGKETP